MVRVNSQVRSISGEQQRKHTNDQIAMGVGLVLFWPALFFLATPDQKEELAQIKGDYDALQGVALQRHCGMNNNITASSQVGSENPTSSSTMTSQEAKQILAPSAAPTSPLPVRAISGTGSATVSTLPN
jgi:hypothetical protein